MSSHSLGVCVLSELIELLKDDYFEIHLFLYSRFLDINFFSFIGSEFHVSSYALCLTI